VSSKEISIVIPSLNSMTIHETLDSLRAQDYDLTDIEIIVVGLDDHGLVIEDEVVRFVSTGGPVCAAAARNIGMGEARGDHFLFIDSDCVAARDWVHRLMERHALGEKVVGGGVAFAHDSYWALCDNVSRFHEFLADSEPGYRPFLPTLNLSVAREVALKAGPLDESLQHGEDIDWTIRLRKLGHRLCFEPRAIVCHRPSRRSLKAVLHHSAQSGYNMCEVRLRHSDILRTPSLLRSPAAILALSPIAALRITGGIFARHPSLLRYVHTLPVVFLTKMAWCLGAARRARLMKASAKFV
jgi:GT2 family glycosyltransferase